LDYLKIIYVDKDLVNSGKSRSFKYYAQGGLLVIITPEYNKTPVYFFKNHSWYLFFLVQKNAFFCTKQLYLLYKRMHCFVQDYIKLRNEK